MRIRKPKPVYLLLIPLCLAVLVMPPVEAQAEAAGDGAAMQGIGKGRVSYRLYCRSCHGDSGKGDGSVADLLEVRPADLTKISTRRDGEFPVEEILQIVDGRTDVRGHGSKEMPIWGDSFKVTEETRDETVVEKKITQLVYYLKSIQVETEIASNQ